MDDTLLDVRNLTIGATVYPPDAAPKDISIVHGVSFTLAKGRVLGLIGESGAGKSTIGLSAAPVGHGGQADGGFARAGFPDQPQYLALGQGKRHAMHD